eukprot:2635011-Rhodomonas_salina.1
MSTPGPLHVCPSVRKDADRHSHPSVFCTNPCPSITLTGCGAKSYHSRSRRYYGLSGYGSVVSLVGGSSCT